jgi:carboxyl-terminal processing protease
MNPSNSNHGLGRLGYLLTLTLALGLAGGVALDRVAAGAMDPPHAARDFRLIAEAWRIVQGDYVDRAAVQPQTMSYGAISGMVNALGDTGHSRFLSPDMVKNLRNLQQNKLEGVGAEIQVKAGHVVIVAALDDSPAQRAGLNAGDIILKVNGDDISGLPLDQVVARVSGPAGTSVTLTILNASSGLVRDVTLVRASIALRDVTWQRLPDSKVAHLRIASFGRGMAVDLHKALAEISNGGAKGIVLDLRNNPGGLLDEAIDATSQFLKNGNVLLIKNSQGTIKPIPVKPGGDALGIPLAVLINSGTASAAEIMAGALSDTHRATLLGATTFGTGTVLREFALSDGSALLLAIEEWLTPAGQLIWHRGVTPEIRVDLPPGASPILPDEERDMTAAQLKASKDNQLLRALDLLSSSNVGAGQSGLPGQ